MPPTNGMVCVHCGSPPTPQLWLCARPPKPDVKPAPEPPKPPSPPDTWGQTVPNDLKALVREWLANVREGRNAYSIAAGCRREIEMIVQGLEADLPREPRKRSWWAEFWGSLADPPKPRPPTLSERIARLCKGGLLTNDFVTPAKALEAIAGEGLSTGRLHVSPEEAETALRFLIALILVHYEAPSWLNGR